MLLTAQWSSSCVPIAAVQKVLGSTTPEGEAQEFLKSTLIKDELKSKTVKGEIFLPVKELVLIDKYKPSIRFWSLSLFC